MNSYLGIEAGQTGCDLEFALGRNRTLVIHFSSFLLARPSFPRTQFISVGMGPSLLKRGLGALVLLAVCAADSTLAAGVVAPNRALTIGADEPLNIAVPVGQSRDETVSYPGASYIAVHFQDFGLPAGDFVVVRSPVDPSAAHFYEAKGRDNRGDFVASLVPGDTAIVQYVSADSSTDASVSGSSAALLAFKISGSSRGFPASSTSGEKESICGAGDDSRPAKCYATERPEMYRKARAVARLLIDGTGLCTGWLAGSGGYVITNHHCIPNATTAASIDFEFGAESDSCSSTTCGGQLGCRRAPVATTSTLIVTNSVLDYSVVKLPVAANVAPYGHLQYRPAAPVAREEIYIPQHPNGLVKRISVVVDDGSAAKIESLAAKDPCGGTNRVVYLADTQPGSSGSPVLAGSDDTVVALHTCGSCMNSGASIAQIVRHMKINNAVIPDFAMPAPLPMPMPTPTPTPLVADRCSVFSEALCSEYLCEWSTASTSCSSFQ